MIHFLFFYLLSSKQSNVYLISNKLNYIFLANARIPHEREALWPPQAYSVLLFVNCGNAYRI